MLKVKATDQDEGINAEITYSFKTLRGIGNMFVLDHQSGEIKSNGPIDFEISSSYTISVEAKDGGGMTSECKIILDIVDENDNAPEVVFIRDPGPWTRSSRPGMPAAGRAWAGLGWAGLGWGEQTKMVVALTTTPIGSQGLPHVPTNLLSDWVSHAPLWDSVSSGS